jgi:uncharacterized membrane protein
MAITRLDIEAVMKYLQQSWEQQLLLLLALVGAGISVYLTAVHYENVPLICSNNGAVNCARVLSSPYSLVPGTSIPISVPGLAWCLVLAGLAIIGLRTVARPRWLNIALFLWAFLGILTALYLVYVEIVLLHSICAWCTALHVIILLVFLITLIHLQQTGSEEAEIEKEQPAITTARNRR